MQQRDKRKRLVCKANGITLLVIPYWWNQSIEDLASSINNVRPDVVPSAVVGNPISTHFFPEPRGEQGTIDQVRA